MVKLSTSILVIFYSGLVFSQAIAPDKLPTSNTLLREADVMHCYRIWRKVSVLHKKNKSLFYPFESTNHSQNLFQAIIAGILSNRLQVYSSEADDFTVPITKHEAFKRLNYVKFSRTIDINSDPEDPEFFEQIDSLVYSPKDLLYYILKEDWIIDNKRSSVEQRIIGICPVVKSFATDGTERGSKELFWIYYPNARFYLTNVPISKFEGDTAIKSFDDFFIKRAFSSSIIKASNVQDRTINKEYERGFLIGIDAENESEKIKAKILELEQNLWHH